MEKEKLIEKIKYHNKLYWEDSNPVISDIEYDKIMVQLEQIDPNHELLNIHKNDNHVFTSLEKTYYFDKAPKGTKSLKSWLLNRARTKDELFLVQPKLDGISAYYKDNVLLSRETDISDKLELIKFAPGTDMTKPVRGEIIITDTDFETIFSKIPRKDGSYYKNSRNAVSGILNMKDISGIRKYQAKLTLVPFDKISNTCNIAKIEVLWDKIVKDIKTLDYPTDGIVIKLLDKKYAESLGSNNTFTKDSIAFKFKGEVLTSKLLNVIWQMGKENLTPVGQIVPITLGGVMIQKVTLHNIRFILDNDIKINDELLIERAGDVIPHCIRNLVNPNETHRKNSIIRQCPYCGGKVDVAGPELKCMNPNCYEKLQHVLHSSILRLGIEGLGMPTLTKLWTKLNVRTVKDLLFLTLDNIKQIGVFQEKSAINLFNNIQTAKTIKDYQFLASFNIPLIGLRISKNILSKMTLEELFKLDYNNIKSIKGVGEELAINLSSNLECVEKMYYDYINFVTIEREIQTNNNTICFTGKAKLPRAQLRSLAIKNKFTPVDSVTKDLKLLVVDDLNSKSSKMKKANNFNIPIMTISEWLQKYDTI